MPVSMRELASASAMVLTLTAFYPYIAGILRRTIRPHVFSWVIWGLATLVVFFAQLQAGGGIGAWPIGLSAGLTILVAVLAWLRRADVTITRLDWCFLIAALLSLPLWYLTTDPLWTVMVLTVVDALGFGPTFRKVYADPRSESSLFYGVFMLRNLLVIVALESRSATTVFFPAAIATACLALIVLMLWRRRLVTT